MRIGIALNATAAITGEEIVLIAGLAQRGVIIGSGDIVVIHIFTAIGAERILGVAATLAN